jgi:4-hydroxybenzoate polyprenyltransferase
MINNYFSLIKFSHTVFALPFAMMGFFLAVQYSGAGLPAKTLMLVLLCMVFARSAAMAFNRYLDRDLDRNNPRTRTREIPAGLISPRAALIFVVINALLFILCTWFINPLCFYLSPLALLVTLGYSYTKRFTALCHFVLGLGLALAPLGAWLAVTASFHLLPILFSVVVLLWVSGFDIIYALQDEDFDRAQTLHSVPAAIGKKNALRLSSILHVLAGLVVLGIARTIGTTFPAFGWIHWMGALAFLALLYYQHTLVKPHDLSKVNMAFFTTNGIAGVVYGSLLVADIYI